jgi:hypothetical protein
LPRHHGRPVPRAKCERSGSTTALAIATP